MQNKILIVGPYLQAMGGIAHNYKVLLSTSIIQADYLEYGLSPNKQKKLYQLRDLFTYSHKLRHYKLINLCPSFEKISLIRDLIYVLIALVAGKKVFISFMGWDEELYSKILDTKYLRKLINSILNCTVHITVPVPFFINKLQQLGITTEITLLYPPFDDQQLKLSQHDKTFEKKLGILFMARIEESKGIYKLLDIFVKLHELYGDMFSFTVCGDGSQLETLKTLTQQKNIFVFFTGNVSGKEKMRHYDDNHIFLYPSYHVEGFPLVLAEVLMNGLIVVSSNTGGIGGVLDDCNGCIIDKNSSADAYVNAIVKLIQNTTDLNIISQYNREFAQNNFSPLTIAHQLNSLYEKLL